jgi:hypothetical protein
MSDWIWLVILLASTGVLLWAAQMKYQHGIWDGAFNQSLPQVQRAMVDYDKAGALRILREKGIPLYIGDADPLGRDHDART